MIQIKNNETLAAEAFSKQSVVFDGIYGDNPIIQYKRERVRTHVDSLLKSEANILELNAGTGEDAIYFAKKGHQVHATDIAEGMLMQLSKKIMSANLQQNITTEKCSFENLNMLKKKASFDLIFSNFAGLNCTKNLDSVLRSFLPLLKPGGIVTLVLLPSFCLWELALALRGNFKAAFRRFHSKHGAAAHIEGIHFTCWYYNPSFIVDILKEDYELITIEGLCTIVPPSYFENFATKHPRIFSALKHLEEKNKSKFPWKTIGDYYIISLRKKQQCY